MYYKSMLTHTKCFLKILSTVSYFVRLLYSKWHSLVSILLQITNKNFTKYIKSPLNYSGAPDGPVKIFCSFLERICLQII